MHSRRVSLVSPFLFKASNVTAKVKEREEMEEADFDVRHASACRCAT